ncbi:hypothetical protein HPB47_026366 [Ixodes persulcatus]|uniref:Uncharacterized protein n=1 Tax=Ixodes persulcatus TaxID=34615 RepID=A0AC60PZF5_IXOPE|nr:hypothetical protein HPB47_026366 [Ixodes persulcatus]
MPSQEALVPSWFEDVEATLESYEVPREWWAGLVLLRLGSTIKLTGAFGEQVIAELAYVPLTAIEGVPLVSFNPSERGILCALTDRLVTGVDVLITLEDYDQLLKERVRCEVQENIEMRGEDVEEEESLDELECT